MADLVVTRDTSLPSSEVIARSVQFFTSGNWRPQTQTDRIATFQGKPPLPGCMIVLTIIAFIAFIVPGIIMYIMVLRKMYRFQNLVVTATPRQNGTTVTINYPKYAKSIVEKFIAALPA